MKKKPFWHNIKFKYKLTIVNESTLEEVTALHVSKLNGLSVLLAVFTVLCVIAACIVSFTPLRNYLPGYMNSDVRKQIVDNALLADSLSRTLEQYNLYVMNLQDVIRGEVRLDSVRSIDSLAMQRSEELMERTSNEERFRKEFEEQEKYNLTVSRNRTAMDDVVFYRPVRGLLATGFNPDGHHSEWTSPPGPRKASWPRWAERWCSAAIRRSTAMSSCCSIRAIWCRCINIAAPCSKP